MTRFDTVHLLQGDERHPLAGALQAIADRAPEGVCSATWALSVALIRGCVLSVQLGRWDAEADVVHDDGPLVTAGPVHAAGDGPTWAVLDLQGREVFGAWTPDAVAGWLIACIEQGPSLEPDGRIWPFRTSSPADIERRRLDDPSRQATWLHLDAWLSTHRLLAAAAARKAA